MSPFRWVCCFVLFACAQAIAPERPFACMSYMEDEKFINDDDDFDEYSSNGVQTQYSAENLNTPDVEDAPPEPAVPHRRICQTDYTFCFALWRQHQNGTRIEKQGCWKESTERNATCSQTECTSSAPTSRNNSLYYCCCSGDSCNKNVAVVEPAPLQLSKPIYGADKNVSIRFADAGLGIVLTVIIVLILCLSVSGFAAYCYVHKIKDKTVPEEAPLAPSGPGYSSNLRNVDNINLICMLGNGKYGTVMKGLLHDKEVAVKIFPDSHYPYYINERNIYSLPMMDSPSLLTYFGYDERHTMDGKIEYQLVLSLAPLGCLQDWLIANAMNFEIFCGMAKSITRGLSHLHTEISRGDEYKPCVAHRDFNSRNVLVKADRTCCIADFGFALKVFGSKYEYRGEVAVAETKSINEVGTLRYMAPELLEGAVNLRDCETSLKQMDVYALGLVLWEVATRCTDFYPPAQMTPAYRAPYEQEVGTHPTFDQMQALVVRHKARPLFPAGWGGGAAAKLLKDTCEDCWDHDAEARLTSLCAEERMQEAAGLRPRYSHTQSPSPLLSANNLLDNDQVDSAVLISMDACHSETATMLQPPPNQKLLPRVQSMDSELSGVPAHTEKNHLINTQQQLQPYQGRNPCQERNLAPVATRPPQILVEKSKKHSFQTGQENSFSCLEDDVSVEDLISGGSTKKISNFMTDNTSSMGEGFPKQHNTDRKLRGWHGVRALIQKKLFRKSDVSADVYQQQFGYSDEKSNLVDNRYAAVVKGLDNNGSERLAKAATVSYIDDRQRSNNGVAATKTTMLTDVYPHTRRPNNLDLSPMNGTTVVLGETGTPLNITAYNKSNLIQRSIAEECNNDTALPKVRLQQLDTRTSTPCHVVPRSLSTSLIKHMNRNNNNLTKSELNASHIAKCPKAVPSNAPQTPATPTVQTAGRLTAPNHADILFRRQRSLEMFREVFSGRGSTDKLRDPSQRVKTPGDVPPSVRKVRASKTLSLYDDRMMDSSTLNIL
uniref:receptor protein serine/threonine kinase n=1 Tax=Ceratitis capitata TaxID=7213 RepID=W8AW93_CERCA